MQYPLLRDLAIIFAGSLLVILVFHRLKLPALPGFIVAGVLLGPTPSASCPTSIRSKAWPKWA